MKRMSSSTKDSKAGDKSGSRSGIRDFIKEKASKLRDQQYTCPFCKEVVSGLSAMGAHLKTHCT